MKPEIETSERERQTKFNEFVDGWDWPRVLIDWNERLKDFNVSLDLLFQTVSVHDPKSPTGRAPALSWWPASIRAPNKDHQKFLDHYPGCNGPIHLYDSMTRGEIDTLAHLWEHKNEPEKIAAILIAGSLFARVESRRSHYEHEKWPLKNGVRELSKWAYTAWQGTDWRSGWSSLNTQVLPVVTSDWDYKIDTMKALVRYLAEEHAALLCAYRPVVIEYLSERDPFIAHAPDTEYEAAWLASMK